MRRLLALTLLAAVAVPTFSACANRSIDEAYGVPDALDWSYFRADPADVVQATRFVLERSGFSVEGVQTAGTSYVISVSSAPSSADFTQIRVEPATFEDYRTRAQVFPSERKLPSDLEVAISAEL